MRLPLVLIGCVTASAAAFADEPAHLMGDAIKLTFQGSLIELDTPLGTTIPVRFTSDGLVSGESRALAPYLGAVRDRGRWWATEDHLCVKWFRWFDAEQRCLKVQVDGDKMFWREENGETGTATLIGREHTTKVAAAVTPLPLQAPTVPAPALAQGPEIARKPLPLPMFATASVIPTLPMPVQERSVVTPPLAQADDAVPLPKQKPASQTSAQFRSKTVSVGKPRKAPAPDIASEAPKAAPPSGPELFRVVGVERGDVLNVRNGPSEYNDPVGTISPNERGVRIVGACRNYWCPIEYRRTSGWVNRYYLAEDFQAGSERAAQR